MDKYIQYWMDKRILFIKLGKNLEDLRYKISAHKAGLMLGRDFNESADSYIERHGLKDFMNWFPDQDFFKP